MVQYTLLDSHGDLSLGVPAFFLAGGSFDQSLQRNREVIGRTLWLEATLIRSGPAT